MGLSLTPRRFLAFQLAAGLLGAAVGRLAAGRFDFEGSGLPAAVALGGILGFALPRIVMGLLYRRRLGRSLLASQGFHSGLHNRIGLHGPPPAGV